MTGLDGGGISIDLPSGWEGQIYPTDLSTAELSAGGTSANVAHLANFALPANRGDFGSGAVEIMNANGVLIVLFEYERSSAGTTLFSSTGLPTLRTSDFRTDQLQRQLAGQAGAQYFFSEKGRAFCIYVVLGSSGNRTNLVAIANQVVAGITIS